MKTHEFILLPHIQSIIPNAVGALRNGFAVAVCGEEGVGTTAICREVCESWKSENSGTHFAFTAYAEADQLRLIHHLVVRIMGGEMPKGWRLYCASELLQLMGEKVRASKVGLIFIDRADLAPPGFIDAILTMASNCADAGSPIGILLGFRKAGSQFRFLRHSAQRVSLSPRP